jgi:hypothetical protein
MTWIDALRAGWMDLELGLFAPDGCQVFGWSMRLNVKPSDAQGHRGFQTDMTQKPAEELKRRTQ